MRVYYLTGAQFALSNLALRRIKIARFEDLNDPFDLLGVDVGDKEHRAAFRATKEQINESKGLICLQQVMEQSAHVGSLCGEAHGPHRSRAPRVQCPAAARTTRPALIKSRHEAESACLLAKPAWPVAQF